MPTNDDDSIESIRARYADLLLTDHLGTRVAQGIENGNLSELDAAKAWVVVLTGLAGNFERHIDELQDAVRASFDSRLIAADSKN